MKARRHGLDSRAQGDASTAYAFFFSIVLIFAILGLTVLGGLLGLQKQIGTGLEQQNQVSTDQENFSDVHVQDLPGGSAPLEGIPVVLLSLAGFLISFLMILAVFRVFTRD
jgi:hypothetical protein